MKTTKLLALVLLLLVGFNASTQSQFYVKLGAGYGFLPVAGFPYQESAYPGSDSSSLSYKSWGLGIYPTLGFGYMVTKNIAIELNGSYLIGTKLEPTTPGGTQKYTASGIFISPALRIQAPLKSVTPYTRMGLMIGLPQIKSEITPTGADATLEAKTKGGVTLGIEAGLGMDIKAGKKLNVFIELFGQALNWKPTDYEVTATYTGGPVVGTTTLTDWDHTYLPFGTFGAKVGISYLFGKMPKK